MPIRWLGTSFAIFLYVTHTQSKCSRKNKLDMSIRGQKMKKPSYSRSRSLSSP
ncbi:hypothetical protein HYC85_007770 [Camellia sinensis]|uniref:Uncharacterized protein n=1 Tax=Camellia sinensis TaxID=4442 RepID=A0A7J7HSB2_CAMSI|nr:hypothetical protein HYC85_007770 [Camellia sinensis]